MSITNNLKEIFELQKLDQLSNLDRAYYEVCVNNEPIETRPTGPYFTGPGMHVYDYTKDGEVYVRSRGIGYPNTSGYDPYPNTDYFIKKQKSKNLLLCIGESWTYGDSITGVKAINKQDNFRYRIEHVFACHMARILNCDYYVSAIPGDAIHLYTIQLAKAVACFKDFFHTYDNVYIVFQLTEKDRCDFLSRTPLKQMYEDSKLYIDIPHEDKFYQEKTLPEFLKEGNNTIKDFCKQAEQNYMYFLQIILKHIPVKHKVICWQNFHHWHQSYNDENIHIVKTPWMHYTNLLEGKGQNSVELPDWFNRDNITKFYKKFVMRGYFDNGLAGTIRKEVHYLTKIIQENWDPIIHNERWHNWHPHELYHFMWALYMLNDSGWIKDSENFEREIIR